MKPEFLSTKAHDELQLILSLERELEYFEEKAKLVLKRRRENLVKILEEIGEEDAAYDNACNAIYK